VTLSYLEVVKVYTKAAVPMWWHGRTSACRWPTVAAVSLLIDYTLTVGVSVAAGVAALTSVFPRLTHATVWIAIVLVILIAFGNLRGVREAGKVLPSPPTSPSPTMAILLAVGAFKAINGNLHAHSIHQPGAIRSGTRARAGSTGDGVRAPQVFASGGSALTGTEAISNGVSIFRRPEARNARITMVSMSLILGSLVLGVSTLAAITHPVPTSRDADRGLQIATYCLRATAGWAGRSTSCCRPRRC